MGAISGTYRGGHIELDGSVDWPEGSRVSVSVNHGACDCLNEGDWSDTAENREELLQRFEAIQELGLTADEVERIEAAWAESKRFNVEAVRKQMGIPA